MAPLPPGTTTAETSPEYTPRKRRDLVSTNSNPCGVDVSSR